MAARKGGLGRGLDALIPAKKPAEQTPAEIKPKSDDKKSETNTSEKKDSLSEKKAVSKFNDKEEKPIGERTVRISKVEPNRSQPRKKFDEDALIELSESIKQYGVLQPLLVSDKKDYYEIIAGERRWRAAKMAGLKEIPVIVKEFSDEEVVEISLIENIQREDLNPIEEAQAYKRLLEEFSLKQDEIADKVSKSRTAVTNSLRLLKLDEKVQQMLTDDMISAGHARALLALPTGELQVKTAQKIFDEKLNVRETEKLVRQMTTTPVVKRTIQRNFTEDAVYESITERMKSILGTKVFINRKRNNKGKIEIEYYSMEELERIMDLFNSIG